MDAIDLKWMFQSKFITQLLLCELFKKTLILE